MLLSLIMSLSGIGLLCLAAGALAVLWNLYWLGLAVWAHNDAEIRESIKRILKSAGLFIAMAIAFGTPLIWLAIPLLVGYCAGYDHGRRNGRKAGPEPPL